MPAFREGPVFLYLEAPIERVTGYDVPFPLFAREDAYVPDRERIRERIEPAQTDA